MGTNQNTSLSYITDWIIKYKYIICLVFTLACIGLSQGQKLISFNTDYHYFFGDDTEQTKAMEELENTYSKNDNIYLSITPNDGRTVFRPEILRAIIEATKKSWLLPYSTRVDSISNFQRTSADSEGLVVKDLIQLSELNDPKYIEEIKAFTTSEILLLNRLISPDGLHTGINVVLSMPGESLMETPTAVMKARELRDQIEVDFPVTVGISGVTVLNNTFGEIGAADLGTLTHIMYGIMIVILLLLFRSIFCVLSAMAVVYLSTSATMGIVGYAGILISPPSSIAATAVLALAVADSVHILMTMMQHMRNGVDKNTAIKLSVLKNAKPIFLSSITTVIGFLSLNFCDAPPYHDLGNITALGVIIALILSVSFLPALLAILPFRVKGSDKAKASSSKFFSALQNFVEKQKITIVGSYFLISVAAIAVIPQLVLDDRFVEYFTNEVEFRRDSDHISQNLTGLYTVEFNLKSSESGGISDPDFMKIVDEFSNYYRAHEDVYNVFVYTDTIKRINQSLHNDDLAYYRLPVDREESSQYLLLYEMSLPYGLDLTNQINIDKSSAKVVITMRDVSTLELRQAAERGERWLVNNAPESMHATGSGATVVFSHISKANIEGMISGTMISFILITLIIILSLMSFKYGLLSVLANVSPALIAIGFWTLLYGVAGMEISIVISATLGVIVDDCVHFLSSYVNNKKQGLEASEAIKEAFSSVGNALIYTSVILISGFLVLTMSNFSINSALGLMSAITILLGLLINLFFMPAFLLLVDGKRRDVNVDELMKTA